MSITNRSGQAFFFTLGAVLPAHFPWHFGREAQTLSRRKCIMSKGFCAASVTVAVYNATQLLNLSLIMCIFSFSLMFKEL